jgi:hypothetical protein
MDVERRAERAKALLNDEVLKDAFAQIEADCVAQWKSTSALSHKKREKLWAELKAIESLKGKLQSFADTGRLIQAAKK